ncbi:hypothetical protein AB205_0220760 [Aquarana catesbeiana]|uniref:IF rod domain-containing protein n=1 Tax=Aquarana catesbeiana TaxID=8400 RepID=A0A2G9S3P8_AQUCT|nr:hypothetical protein AB205_0220760 [Aquarana catesbeiana]
MSHSQHKQGMPTPLKAGVHVRSHSPKLSVHHGIGQFSHHGGYHKVHHTTHNTHGGASKPIIFTKHSSITHGCGYGSVHSAHNNDNHFNSIGSHGGWKNDGFFNVNEKETMQLLNDRLATYLEKVHSLEQENAQMEKKICEWYDKNSHISTPDFQHYYKAIEELQSRISTASLDNARVVLQIDNARLATDDFKNKYELEGRLRTFDVTCLRNQLGARISVHVDAAPSVDLTRVLSEVREQYENLMERNLREVESIFIARSEELNREVASGSEQLQSVQTELIDLKRCLQTLEIELQSQLSMKSALECTLAETEATFGSQLHHLQNLIDNVEDQLSQIRSELERQIYEYKILMDQTTHLEMEITTYKRLLEAQDIQ